MLRNRLLIATLTCTLGGFALATTQPWAAPQDQGPTVTEEHKRMLETVGEWTGVMVMDMGQGPVSYDCTETITAVGELWVTSAFHCEFMGMDFDGASSMGYDPETSTYTGTWIDSTTNHLTIQKGSFDKAKNAIVMEYEGPDAMTGKMVPMRLENVGTKDAYMMTFFQTVDGTTTQTMTISMKRVMEKK
ncbi:MAG: hypothetical protein ACI8QC_001456 [Planctomycetota bacterium]|jgi:hypothetical protein